MATATATHRLSGDDLRLLRVAKHITASDVARHFGCSRQGITAVEGTLVLTTAAVARYVAALAAAEQDR